MRELARAIGVSLATVSDSLRGDKRVNTATRERVLKAAHEFGYRYNSLAGSVMSQIRRSSVGQFRGVIGLIDLEPPEARPKESAAFHRLLLEGAREAAEELGYRADFFNTAVEGLSMQRLAVILESRGISAIVLLPVFGKPDVVALPWERLAGIYTDYMIDDPPLNRIASDHYMSLTHALDRLSSMGYQRPGLVVNHRTAERLLHRIEAAMASHRAHHQGYSLTRPLRFAGKLTAGAFRSWFRREQPDVVLGHIPEILNWMNELGCRVPDTHGFCSLNVVSTGVPTAGLDLMPRMVGQRAVQMLIAQLQRNEFGIPEVPLLSSYESQWRDGPTLRDQRQVSELGARLPGGRPPPARKKLRTSHGI